MKTPLPTYQLPGTATHPVQHFVSVERFTPDRAPLPMGLETDAKIRGFTSQLWEKTYREMEPEHYRMTRNELYYSGRHLQDPIENAEAEITNYPFSLVETVVPELVQQKPRPEVQALDPVASANADKLNEWANWIMNTDGYDSCYRKGTREMCKLGWNINLVVGDPRTGMPYPKPWCNWDFYPDFTAHHEDDMMYFFLAAPINTRLLQSMFPEHAHLIQPDNWVSPSYDAHKTPYLEAMQAGGGVNRQSGMVVPYAHYEGQPQPAGSTVLSSPNGQRSFAGGTTFLFQLFVRDMTQMRTVYAGQRWMRGTDGSWTWHWAHMQVPELACGSGWRVIQMTSSGVVLDVAPLDTCYWGLPIVMGRDYEQAFRMFCPGEIDHIIPKVRAINRRAQLLNLALEYQANPVLVADRNTGINFDKGALVAGEVLRKNPGTTVDWMNYRGPGEQQFLVMQGQRQDIDVVSGVHDVMQGQRPPGIEAGVAIGLLQQQGKSRIRGKEGAIFDANATLLKKLMVFGARKLRRDIQFRGSNGSMITIDPEVLESEFSIQFAPGSGLLDSRQAKKNEMLELFKDGAIDQEALLKAFDVKDRDDIVRRMQAAQMAQQQAQIQMAQLQALGGGGRGQGDSQPSRRAA